MQTQTSIKTISGQLTELLTRCLANAIDTAMRETDGEDWFQQFKFEDLKDDHPILKFQNSVSDCDLQAMLKLLRYRNVQSEKVFAYHGFAVDGSKEGRQRKLELTLLLDRLIVDFRNTILAHPKAGTDTEPEQVQIYSYEEAARDMIRLAALFPDTRDEEETAYSTRMEQLLRQHELVSSQIVYPISATMQNEKLRGMSERQFAAICRKRRIRVQSVEGKLCFLSNNYAGDIETIKSYRKQQKRKFRVCVGVIASGLVILAILGTALFAALDRKKAQAAEAALADYQKDAVAEAQKQEQINEIRELIEKVCTVSEEETEQYFYLAPNIIMSPEELERNMGWIASDLKRLHEKYERYAIVTEEVIEPYLGQQTQFYAYLYFYDTQAGHDIETVKIGLVQEDEQWTVDPYCYRDDEWGSGFRGASDTVLEGLVDVVSSNESVSVSTYGDIPVIFNNGSDEPVLFRIDPANVAWELWDDGLALVGMYDPIDEYVMSNDTVRSSKVSPDVQLTSFAKHYTDDEGNDCIYYELQTAFDGIEMIVPAHTAVTAALPMGETFPFRLSGGIESVFLTSNTVELNWTAVPVS